MFFFQAEDGIRDLVRSRGLGDVYKRQVPDALGELQVGDAVAADTPLGALAQEHVQRSNTNEAPPQTDEVKEKRP